MIVALREYNSQALYLLSYTLDLCRDKNFGQRRAFKIHSGRFFFSVETEGVAQMVRASGC